MMSSVNESMLFEFSILNSHSFTFSVCRLQGGAKWCLASLAVLFVLLAAMAGFAQAKNELKVMPHHTVLNDYSLTVLSPYIPSDLNVLSLKTKNLNQHVPQVIPRFLSQHVSYPSMLQCRFQ
jgi:hypothetical protein